MPFRLNLACTLLEVANKAYKSPKKRKIGEISIRSADLDERTMADVHASSPKFDTEFFVVANSSGDIVVAYRGSETSFFTKSGAWRDWVMTDFDAKPIPWPGREKRGGNTVYVHRGIWMAYQAAANSLYEIVRDLLKKKYRKKPRILVTGHSLGGALAQFAGNDLGAWFPNVKTEVYTFAAPRVGDADFEAVLCSNADGVYQVINEHDPVPYVPPVGPNWARKDKKYKTAGATKYLRGNGKITKAPKAALAIWPFNHQIKAYRKALEKAVERRAGADNAVTAAVTDAKDLAETAAGQVSKAVDNTARDAAKTAKKATKSVDRAAKKASRDAKRTLNKVLKGPKKLFGG